MIYWGKQPSENVPRTIDFSNALPEGETLNPATSTITATDSLGVNVTSTLLSGASVSSPYVTIRNLPMAAGVYRIRFLMVTTPGSYLIEEDVELTVKEQ